MISIIVAIAEDNAIGKKGDLLCHLPADLKHFKETTLGHPVLMGRKTWFSLPRRPLPGRRNIVITHATNQEGLEGAEVMHSIDEALAAISADEECFVIGGGTIYEQMLPMADKLCLTKVHATFADADTFFPAIDWENWQLTKEEVHQADEKNPYDYTFADYAKK